MCGMTDTNPSTAQWLTREQVAARLGVSPSSVDRYRKATPDHPPRLPTYYAGTLPRFRIEDVDTIPRDIGAELPPITPDHNCGPECPSPCPLDDDDPRGWQG